MEKGAFADLVKAGEVTVHVTPNAGCEAVDRGAGGLRIRVTAPPDRGRANRAVAKLVARALGVPRSRLRLIRGAAARIKVFGID